MANDQPNIAPHIKRRLDGTLKCFIDNLLYDDRIYGDFHMTAEERFAIAGGLFFAFNRDSDLAGIAIKYGVNTVNENGRFRA